MSETIPFPSPSSNLSTQSARQAPANHQRTLPQPTSTRVYSWHPSSGNADPVPLNNRPRRTDRAARTIWFDNFGNTRDASRLRRQPSVPYAVHAHVRDDAAISPSSSRFSDDRFVNREIRSGCAPLPGSFRRSGKFHEKRRSASSGSSKDFSPPPSRLPPFACFFPRQYVQ